MQIVFLASVTRSGSTFLANQLSRHPAICVCPEAGTALSRLLSEPAARTASRPEIVSDLLVAMRRDAKLRTWNLAPDRLQVPDGCRAYDVFVQLVDCYRRESKPESTVVVVKGGMYLVRAFRWIRASQVPDAKILFLVRDGRAVYASQKSSRASLTGRPMQVSPVASAHVWCRFARDVEALRGDPRAQVVRYEDLISSTSALMERNYAWLTLRPPPAEASPDFAARIPPAQVHLHPWVSKPPDVSKIDRWRATLSRVEIRLYEDQAGHTLCRFGYKPEAPSVPVLLHTASRVWFGLHGLYHIVARRAHRRLRDWMG